MQNNDEHRYDDMMDPPHHVSAKRPQMSWHDRAAQFSAFRALTGYEDAVTEAARLIGERIELDDASLSLLNAKILKLCNSEPLPFTMDELVYQYNGITTNVVLKGINLR